MSWGVPRLQLVRKPRVGLERNIHGGGVRGGLAQRAKVDRDVKCAAVLDTAGPFAAGMARDAPNIESNGHGVHQAARMRDILQLAVFRAQHQILACPNAKVAAWVLWVIADGIDGGDGERVFAGAGPVASHG